MLNQFILVGRITKIEQGKVVVAIPRSYKNNEGIYDTDFVSVTIKGNIEEKTREYCRKGDLIGIKGHFQSKVVEKKYIQELIAEKISFLSSSKGSVENGNE